MAKATTAKKAAPAKGAAKQLDIIDIGETLPGEALAVKEDQDFVTTAGLAVKTFLGSALVFFTRAGEIERAAIATLVEAEALQKTPPATEADDRKVQNFILKTNADKKVAEEHWKITKQLHAFHARMTGARARATGPLEKANAIANALHNNYKDAELRRVERETREAEERATREQQRLRDEELAELERQVVAAEEKAPDLSAREQKFVDAYMSNVTGWRENGRRAAEVAGFKKPLEEAARLLSMPKMQKAIAARREAELLREQKEAVARQPLDVVAVEEVRPAVAKAAGSKERTTWSAEVFNERALIDAIIDGKLGIPTSLLRIDQTEANTFADSLQEQINRWPGVRAKKKTVTF